MHLFQKVFIALTDFLIPNITDRFDVVHSQAQLYNHGRGRNFYYLTLLLQQAQQSRPWWKKKLPAYN